MWRNIIEKARKYSEKNSSLETSSALEAIIKASEFPQVFSGGIESLKNFALLATARKIKAPDY